MEISREVFFGYATNISGAGICIQTINPKPAGFRIRLRFNLPGDKETIECSAEVAWSKEYNSKACHRPGMGLKFVDLEEQDKARIDAFGGRKCYSPNLDIPQLSSSEE